MSSELKEKDAMRERRFRVLISEYDDAMRGIGVRDPSSPTHRLDAAQALEDAYTTVLDELASLRSELASARKDSERLDWLEREIADPSEPNVGQGIYIVPTDTDKWRWHDCATGTEHATFREAIDAALSSGAANG